MRHRKIALLLIALFALPCFGGCTSRQPSSGETVAPERSITPEWKKPKKRRRHIAKKRL